MKRLIYILMFFALYAHAELYGQGCYEVVETNTGISAYVSENLDQKACELELLLDNSGNSGFDVLGCDFYPIMAYAYPTDGFPRLFDKAIFDLNINRESYSMVTKEHQTDGGIFYRAHIKFPSTITFDTLTTFEKEGIRTLFIDAIKAKALTSGNSLAGSAEAEIAGLNVLIEIFGQIINGSFSLGNNVMAIAGFEGAAVGGDEYFERTVGAGLGVTDGIGNKVHDFTGLKVGDANSSKSLYRDQISVKLSDGDNPFKKMNALNHLYILTDVESTQSELSSAEFAFENSTEKVKVWLHFNEVDSNEKIDSVFIKFKCDLTITEAEEIVDEMFNYYMSKWMPELFDENGLLALRGSGETLRFRDACNPNWKWGKTCLLPEIGGSDGWFSGITNGEFAGGLGVGLLDGLLGTVQVFYESGKNVSEVSKGWWESIKGYTRSLVQTAIARGSVLAVAEKVWNDAAGSLKAAWNEVVAIYDTLSGLIETAQYADFKLIIEGVWTAIKSWMEDFINGEKEPAYDVGVICFDVVVTAFSGGTAAGSKFLPTMLNWVKKLKTKVSAKEMVTGIMKDVDKAAGKLTDTGRKIASKANICKIFGRGCFVAGTPVLLAGMTTVPIEEVKLLDWVLANSTVNQEQQLLASNDDNFNGLIEGDPYTSKQQIERDRYKLDDENWYKVVLKEVLGTSICKLALHQKWIDEKGYNTNSVVKLDLPEQGISGQFQVVSIEHIIPQKKPSNQSQKDSFKYKPVTGIFIHQSDKVWIIKFNNGDSLGVTENHPIYSNTYNRWSSASDLGIGESVLTKSGSTIVLSKERCNDSYSVYNLEVKELHNFLVGGTGIVVHNNCWKTVRKQLENLGVGTNKHRNMDKPSNRNRHKIDGSEADDVAGKFGKDKMEICYDDLGFPDFNEYVPKIGGQRMEFVIDMNGNNRTGSTGDYGQVFDQLESILGFRPSKLSQISFSEYPDISWTLHHHQDGKTMQLVPRVLNSNTSHVGGNAIVKKAKEKGIDHKLPSPKDISKYKTLCQ